MAAQYKACISDMSSRLAYARHSTCCACLYGNAIRIPATVVFSHFLLEGKCKKGESKGRLCNQRKFHDDGVVIGIGKVFLYVFDILHAHVGRK